MQINQYKKCSVNNAVTSKGFSLLEAITTISIMAILASLAIPVYQSKMRMNHRLDATLSLMNIEQQQEVYRNSHQTYGNLTAVWGESDLTPKAYYKLSLIKPTATGFTVIATAQGKQALDAEGDVSCEKLTIEVNRLKTSYTPKECWSS